MSILITKQRVGLFFLIVIFGGLIIAYSLTVRPPAIPPRPTQAQTPTFAPPRTTTPSATKAPVFQYQQTNPDVPMRLKIPRIAVDTTIEPVGITSSGVMDATKNPDTVAWFTLGPRPGGVGSAVIAGHYGWLSGKGSVFNLLHTLKAGDTVLVDDEKGKPTSFVVRESRKYSLDANVPEVFSSQDGKSHLNLITCGGVWNKSRQTYSHRLVVFTDKTE